MSKFTHSQKFNLSESAMYSVADSSTCYGKEQNSQCRRDSSSGMSSLEEEVCLPKQASDLAVRINSHY